MKCYTGNPNSIADSIISLLYDYQLSDKITKNAKQKVKNDYNWTKLAQDTHFVYQKSICKSVAEKQAEQMIQERARKTKKLKNSDGEISSLIPFKKRQAYA